jgi:hypothetical protein
MMFSRVRQRLFFATQRIQRTFQEFSQHSRRSFEKFKAEHSMEKAKHTLRWLRRRMGEAIVHKLLTIVISIFLATLLDDYWRGLLLG